MDIAELYRKVFQACVDFAVYQKGNIRKNVETMLPLIEKFSDYFLSRQAVEIDEEDYSFLQVLWMDILKDIASGLKENDRIFLEDAVEYGLKVFLEMFFEEQELQRLREESVVE